MEPRAVRAAYDEVAETYAHRFPGTEAEGPLELAMLELFAAGGGVVLDAGCGTGRVSRFLVQRGCRVVGVDVSPGMLAAALRADADFPVVAAELAALPFADGCFDGVLLWYSLIHTAPERRGSLVAAAARVLRPGGSVLVGFQHGSGPRDVAPAYRGLGHEVELVRWRCRADEVVAELAAVGLAEVARVVRAPDPGERDEQAVVLARSPLQG